MNIGYTIGRLRVCSFCSRKISDTDNLVFVEEDHSETVLCCEGDTVRDRIICLWGWIRMHPNSIFNFAVRRICEVEQYVTWPPELTLVT